MNAIAGNRGTTRAGGNRDVFQIDRVAHLGDPAASAEITEILTAPRSPWQSPYVERLIGSIRRECLDHVIVVNERSLQRHVASILDYYHGSRSHLSLGKDTPDGRAVESPSLGRIFAVPKVGGLHHRYGRRAA